MPIDQALPDEAPFGVADWTNLEDNWREEDAEWLQGLGVPRFSTTAQRDAKLTGAPLGKLCFNQEAGYVQIKGASAWSDYKPLPLFLTKGEDSASQVLLAHTAASGKGVSFSGTGPGYEVHVNTNFKVQNGVLTVDTTGVSIKTGANTVKLTTDGTNLVSDAPIKAPSLSITGAVGGGALTVTSINAPSGTVTALTTTTLTATNITLTGVLTGGTGTLGGVGLASNIVTVPAGGALANAAGIQLSQGFVYGDTTGVSLRHRTSAGVAASAAYLQVAATDVNVSATNVNLTGSTALNMLGQVQIESNRSIQYITTAGTFNGGPVIYQATDPVVGSVPEGTIWCDV